MAVPAGFFVFFGFFAVFFLSVFLVAAYALSKLLTAGRMTTAPKPAIIAERISFFTWQLHFSNAGRRSIRYYQHAIRKSTEGFQYLSCPPKRTQWPSSSSHARGAWRSAGQ